MWDHPMKDIRKIVAGVVSGTVVFLLFQSLLWALEQREHGKDYWLILAHVVPFVIVVLLGAFLVLLLSGWLIKRAEKKAGRTSD